MHSEDLLSIGDFAALARLSVKALRHYDEQGLLSPVRVDPVTRYRQYLKAGVEPEEAVGRAMGSAGKASMFAHIRISASARSRSSIAAISITATASAPIR